MRIALASGDGIGPEIMDATLTLFRAAGVDRHVEFVPVEMGKSVFERGNTRGMTDAAVRTVEDCGILFKGPMETPKGGGGKSINVTARKIWSAFANYRHFRSLPGVQTPFSHLGLDFAIVRENVEDTYGGIEHRVSDDVMVCKRVISAPGCDEVLRFAFETARKSGITSIHCGHKANIMKMTDGLFLERFKAMGKDFPELELGDVIVDALCMNLVIKPGQYAMVVLPNLQGDIVSDLCAGLVGGLGVVPAANLGTGGVGVFEAVHGTAPDIAGQNVANPMALLLSAVLMLQHLKEDDKAARIMTALRDVLASGHVTRDLGGTASTSSFADAICRVIEQG